MQSTWTLVLSQLVGQLPVLLVYVGGIVLCGVWSRRAPRAAMLAMIGCGLLLLTTVAMSMAQSHLIANNPGPAIGQTMFVIGIGGSVLRAGGLALLIAAVFAGRPRVAEHSGFEVQTYA